MQVSGGVESPAGTAASPGPVLETVNARDGQQPSVQVSGRVGQQDEWA